jgi:hypothetical protein
MAMNPSGSASEASRPSPIPATAARDEMGASTRPTAKQRRPPAPPYSTGVRWRRLGGVADRTRSSRDAPTASAIRIAIAPSASSSTVESVSCDAISARFPGWALFHRVSGSNSTATVWSTTTSRYAARTRSRLRREPSTPLG